MIAFDAVNESCAPAPTNEPRPTIPTTLAETHKMMSEAVEVLEAIASTLGHIDLTAPPPPEDCNCVYDAVEINLKKATQLCNGLHKVFAVLR